MLVILLYMEVLLFSNKKVPCWACKGTKPSSYKNAQHQNQLRCWSTKAQVLFVFITRSLMSPISDNQRQWGLDWFLATETKIQYMKWTIILALRALILLVQFSYVSYMTSCPHNLKLDVSTWRCEMFLHILKRLNLSYNKQIQKLKFYNEK